jgi:YD repeat-containing protein
LKRRRTNEPAVIRQAGQLIASSIPLTYNPPPVAGSGANVTAYDYNQNRQVIKVTRPDGQAIGFEYDTRGRLVTLAVPGGEIGYVYDATTGNLKNIIMG